MDCKIIRVIRNYIHDETQRHLPINDNYQRGDLNIIVQKEENIHWRRLQLTTCFVIWREMHKNKTSLELVREVLIEYKEWFKT
jgi:hypothetical protein